MRKQPHTGFAVVEFLLVLVIVGLLVGVGYWVATQRRSVNSTTASTNPTSTSNTTSAPAAGTTASIDALTSKEIDAETATDSAATNNVNKAATSSNSAASNIGESYNETAY